MTPEEIARFNEQYGGYWGEYPQYPVRDWLHEINEGDTRQGYWDYVVARILEAAEWEQRKGEFAE